jgi:hypothetical protein
MPDCAGDGLEFDPILTLADFDVILTRHRSGTGTVELASTPHDPLGSIPIGAVTSALWQEGDLHARTTRLATIPAEQFLPYFFARIDDYSVLDTETQPLLVG